MGKAVAESKLNHELGLNNQRFKSALNLLSSRSSNHYSDPRNLNRFALRSTLYRFSEPSKFDFLEVDRIAHRRSIPFRFEIWAIGDEFGSLTVVLAHDAVADCLIRKSASRLVGFKLKERLMVMDYELSDSSGTDDDLPPHHQNRFQRGGHAARNGRSAVVGPAPLPRMHNDMETQIHLIEQEAYCSVLRAFKAQSDAITWEKESLITELRKELRVSDEEHRELLSRVNADDIIRRIREWRKSGGLQSSMITTSRPVHDPAPSPAVSASRKKQKTSSLTAPSPALHPSSSALGRGPPAGNKSKKPKTSAQYPSIGLTGRAQTGNRGSSGSFAANAQAEGATYDPHIGRKVWTKWPADNHFYEAVITDYDHMQGLHALVYDINSAEETWEWVNLKEISPEDIRWENDDPGISRRGARPGPGRGVSKKSMMRGGAGPGAGRGRGTTEGQSKKDSTLPQNGIGKKALGDIEIFHTDTLIKEVEKVFSDTHPDPMEIEKAKKVLKEHEQALVDAIARLEDASDGESDHPLSNGQSRGWRKRQYGEMGEGEDGERMGTEHNGQHGEGEGIA